MTSTVAAVVLITLSMLVCSSLVLALEEEPPYDLRIIGISDPLARNTLRLRCFSFEAGRGIRAIFWLNEVSLAELTDVDGVGEGSNDIRFIIDRDLEGNYTCGIQSDPVNRVQSAPKTFVAFPTPVNVDPESLNHRGVSGREARLPCSIRPGKLVDWYIVRWSTASGQQLVEFQWGMAQRNVDTGKYRVDRNDLSLIISDVSPADTGSYVCELGVDGADRADGNMFYPQSPHLNISLVVFDPPNILQPPMPQVVSLPENSVSSSGDGTTFHCRASASTSLDIVWLHDGEDVSRLIDSDKYSVTLTDSTTNGGTTTVSSQLEIMTVGVDDSGEVVCEARIPTSEGVGDSPVTASATTTLSVLGGFQRIRTSITHDGLVLFDIVLHDTILTEVRLLVEYTPTNGQPREMVTEGGFVRNRDILHLERDPPIRDTGFTVRVALITPDFEIEGPFSDRSQTLDVNQAPLSTEALISIAIAVPVAIITVVLVFIIVVLIVVFVKKHKKRTHDLGLATKTVVGRSSNKETIEDLSPEIIKLYNTLKQCDSVGGSRATHFKDSEIRKAVQETDYIVRAGIQHHQTKEEIIKKLKQWIELVQKDKKKFLIDVFKGCRAYKDAVYADDSNDSNTLTLHCRPGENGTTDKKETQNAFAEFMKESLSCLLSKRPDLTSQFSDILSLSQKPAAVESTL